MELSKASFVVFAIFSLIFGVARAQATAAPAPAPTSDGGSSIDQAIAYLLMLLALVLTYIIH